MTLRQGSKPPGSQPGKVVGATHRKEIRYCVEVLHHQRNRQALGVCYSRVLQLQKQGLLDAYSHGEKGSKSKFYFRVEDVERYKQSRDNPEQPPLRKVSTRETA